MNNIHDNIKRIRLAKGLTQEAVATHLFVSRQLISKWEQGKAIPDIVYIDGLARLFQISVDDLIDDESVKSMAIAQAGNNLKRGRIAWLSMGLSLLAILIGLGAWYFISLLPQQEREIAHEVMDVLFIDEDRIVLENEQNDLKFEIDRSRQSPTVRNLRQTVVGMEDLRIGDIVKVSYDAKTKDLLEIQMISTSVDESLYGVFVTGLDNDFDDLYDAIQQPHGMRYAYAKSGSSGWNTTVDVDVLIEAFYIENRYTLEVRINPIAAAQGLYIGLMTSNGIRYVELVDLNVQRSYTYAGWYEVEEATFGDIRHVRVVYQIDIVFVDTVESATMYEYDAFHAMIQETSFDDWQQIHAFRTDEDTMYGLVKYTIMKQGTAGIYASYVVRQWFLGEREVLNVSDDYGFVIDYDFRYRP